MAKLKNYSVTFRFKAETREQAIQQARDWAERLGQEPILWRRFLAGRSGAYSFRINLATGKLIWWP